MPSRRTGHPVFAFPPEEYVPLTTPPYRWPGAEAALGNLSWAEVGATLNAICSAVISGHPPAGMGLTVRALSDIVDPHHSSHPWAVAVACSWLEVWRLADISSSTIISPPPRVTSTVRQRPGNCARRPGSSSSGSRTFSRAHTACLAPGPGGGGTQLVTCPEPCAIPGRDEAIIQTALWGS